MNNLVQKAAKGIRILFLLRIISKVIDFTLNILVIRNINQEIYGLTIHFALLTNLIQFYNKMCLKNSYQKRSIDPDTLDDPKNINLIMNQSAINMMFFGIFVTFLTSFFFGAIWHFLYAHLNKEFTLSIILFSIAAIIVSFLFIIFIKDYNYNNRSILKSKKIKILNDKESIAEPYQVTSILNFDYDKLVHAEGLGMFMRSVSLYLFFKFEVFSPLLCFGFSAIVQSFGLCLISYIISKKHKILVSPKRILDGQKKYYIHPRILIYNAEMKEMGIQLGVVSFMKFLLSEIEKLVLINFIQDPKISAVYQLVSNLGSLVPKYIYLPIEQIAYNLFSKLQQKGNEDEFNVQKMNQKIREVLTKIFRFINIIGILAILFGIPYSKNLLLVLYGQQWQTEVQRFQYQDCIQAMQAFCFYIYIMGINGTSEAFLFGSVNLNELNVLKKTMYFSTGSYLFFAITLIKFKSVGLILANIFSMMIRILICINYSQKNIFLDNCFSQFIIGTFPKGYFFILFFFTAITNQIIVEYLDLIPIYKLFFGGILAAINVAALFLQYSKEIKTLFTKKEE